MHIRPPARTSSRRAGARRGRDDVRRRDSRPLTSSHVVAGKGTYPSLHASTLVLPRMVLNSLGVACEFEAVVAKTTRNGVQTATCHRFDGRFVAGFRRLARSRRNACEFMWAKSSRLVLPNLTRTYACTREASTVVFLALGRGSRFASPSVGGSRPAGQGAWRHAGKAWLTPQDMQAGQRGVPLRKFALMHTLESYSVACCKS